MQTRDGSGLACETASHITIRSIIAQDHLDSDTATKSRTLPPLIDGTHTTNTNTPNDIVVAERFALQRQHCVRLSFHTFSCLLVTRKNHTATSLSPRSHTLRTRLAHRRLPAIV